MAPPATAGRARRRRSGAPGADPHRHLITHPDRAGVGQDGWRGPRPVGPRPTARHTLSPMTHEHLGFSTRAIHAGQEPDPTTGAVVPPIHQVTTYKQDGIGGFRGGYEYSRSANPTRTALEECIAALEGGERGFAFASGLAGEDTVLRALLAPGDHVVVPSDAYGGTYRLFNKVAKPWGVDHSIATIADVDAVRAAIRPETRMVWVETPTNPLLGIADIEAIAERHPRGRRAARRRQHLRLALPAAPDRARRRHRRALDDEVRRRPQRRRRRCGRRRPRRHDSRRRGGRRNASPSTRTRWAPSPGRSTRGSSCAA